MPDLTFLAHEIDGLLDERALVYGSLPDDAHDLDVLIGPRSAAALTQRLPAAGFSRWRGGWARVNGTATHVVDPVEVTDWQLPAAQATAVFDAAQPLPGLRHLAQPAPHHQLLILARRLVRSRGPVQGTKLTRLQQAAAADPHAWDRARAEAAAWGCATQLDVLADVQRTGRTVTRSEAWAGLLAEQGRRGRAWRAPYAARELARRPPRGAVVALSGLDGAGKSTQAAQLAESLQTLGYDTVVQWQRVSYDPSLDRITAPVRAILVKLRRPAAAPSRPSESAGELPPDRLAAQALRQRFPLVGATWVGVVAGRHAWQVRRQTREQMRRGRIVIRDRYELDTVVQLREQYGDSLDVSRHVRLVRLLTPRPVAAWFLDVSADEAWRRKPDEFDPVQLADQRSRYLEELASLGVERLDGEQPPDQIAEKVLREVWRRLTARGRPRQVRRSGKGCW